MSFNRYMPNFEHGCNDCVYLGSWPANQGRGEGITDFYMCTSDLVARNGPEPEQYRAGPLGSVLLSLLRGTSESLLVRFLRASLLEGDTTRLGRSLIDSLVDGWSSELRNVLVRNTEWVRETECGTCGEIHSGHCRSACVDCGKPHGGTDCPDPDESWMEVSR